MSVDLLAGGKGLLASCGTWLFASVPQDYGVGKGQLSVLRMRWRGMLVRTGMVGDMQGILDGWVYIRGSPGGEVSWGNPPELRSDELSLDL